MGSRLEYPKQATRNIYKNLKSKYFENHTSNHKSFILLSQATKIKDLSAMMWYSLIVRARNSILALAFLSI